MKHDYDVVVIGGGINGCGCAVDAAVRGLSVLLCEKDDLASKTSSSSTKLIHGGLRYLEHYDFKLVRKALSERHKLLELAPHLVHPLPIALPYQRNMRPIWLLRLGLFLYDHLGYHNTLSKSKFVQRAHDPIYFSPINKTLDKGFVFYDAMTDDARLTLANAIQAQAFGATVLTQTEVVNAQINQQQWQLTLQPKNKAAFEVRAKVVINAAGPWVPGINQLFNIPLAHQMSLIKGSHLVVHKLYEGDHAYLLQHDDQRVVFVIPYHHHTLIGTTDVAYQGALEDVSLDASEMRYLCDLVSRYFNKTLKPQDIIRSWSGIRPLLTSSGKNPTQLSRDYAYHFVHHPLPMATIYSGKMTTYRQLAVEVIDQLKSVFHDLPDSKTHDLPLPGAALGHEMNYVEYRHMAYKKYYWLEEEILERYLKNYGTRTEIILQSCHQLKDLGIHFSETLYQKEVDYLIEHEWAFSVEDILWRRTKLGLTMDMDTQQRLVQYIHSLGI